MRIPFSKPYVAPRTLAYVQQALEDGRLSGGGRFTDACHRMLQDMTGCPHVLLTQSGTTALEMCALLLELGPGDEVIMPSWTFPSTANAFVLRGAVPVFVDIRPDTLNIDEALIEAAITSRTRAIVAVHYAGVPCEMDAINDIAARHGLAVIEDAAQALGSRYKGRPAGTLGHLAAYSFHATKNIGCGEGGALLINDARFAQAAEEIWDKGTNRAAFLRGEVPYYEWTRVGSSCLPSELTAAVLLAQLEDMEPATARRIGNWQRYHQLLGSAGGVRIPQPPTGVEHNAHIFWLAVERGTDALAVRQSLEQRGVSTLPHYFPLHRSRAAQGSSVCPRPLPVTDSIGSGLLRLPLWSDMPDEAIEHVSESLRRTLS